MMRAANEQTIVDSLRTRGNFGCPLCGGDEVVGRSFSCEGPVAGQDVYCNDDACGAVWHEVYRFAELVLIDAGTHPAPLGIYDPERAHP
jgi:hypothetical protein